MRVVRAPAARSLHYFALNRAAFPTSTQLSCPMLWPSLVWDTKRSIWRISPTKPIYSLGLCPKLCKINEWIVKSSQLPDHLVANSRVSCTDNKPVTLPLVWRNPNCSTDQQDSSGLVLDSFFVPWCYKCHCLNYGESLRSLWQCPECPYCLFLERKYCGC